MINHIGKRAAFGICVFWLGFHFIGLSIWLNGSAYPGNIIWDLFQGVIQVELFILKFSIILTFFILAATFILGLYSANPTKSRLSEKIITTASVNHYSSKENCSLLQVVKQPVERKIEPTVNSASNTSTPPPTSAELKRRALKQITGREF